MNDNLVMPTEDEITQADLLSRKLSHYPHREGSVRIQMFVVESEDTGEASEILDVPLAAFLLFKQMLTQMAKGNAITLFPVQSELTTQQAADLLNISRPYLITLLENQTIPFRKVGTHRRLLAVDVLAYRKKQQSVRREILDQLVALDQEMGPD